MITLSLLTLTLATVSGGPSWNFTSPPATKHDTKQEKLNYTLDNDGFNAIINALNNDITLTKFRLIPPKMTLTYSDALIPYHSWIKPCAPKPGQNLLDCSSYTDPYATCFLFVDLPCKAKPGHSRWEANMLMDITVKKETHSNNSIFTIDDCRVFCLDIGYYDEDMYNGGNGISYEITGIIAAIVVKAGFWVIAGGIYICYRRT
ncbi:uncharacterized protein LOC131947178 [Physella acuta]|uniref:uncharacterized protein LOC131947178 n=1 Tax=Physella acuta TaxID=109671 RepID=UPI0027DB8DBB|nr:uncharacterized protein LOC131947178 [Physella acuta]